MSQVPHHPDCTLPLDVSLSIVNDVVNTDQSESVSFHIGKCKYHILYSTLTPLFSPLPRLCKCLPLLTVVLGSVILSLQYPISQS